MLTDIIPYIISFTFALVLLSITETIKSRYCKVPIKVKSVSRYKRPSVAYLEDM